MATLQKIRNRAGLLIAISIGLALLAFILGDLGKSGSSLFRSDRYEIAEIRGESVPFQLYQQRLEEMIENTKRNTGNNTLDEATRERVKTQTWELLVREIIMGEEFEELGVDVHPDELFDMVQGNNIYPQIKQIPIFQNQETGEFDRQLVIQFLQNLDRDPSGKARDSWLAFEEGIMRDRMNTKYNNLIKQGLYITDLEAKKAFKEKNRKVSFEYIVKRYNNFPDSLVNVTDDDLREYYEAHKDEYKQQEARDIEYVAFDVKPSQEDIKNAREWIEDLYPEFDTIKEAGRYVTLNSDEPFDATYYGEGELSTRLDTFAFNAEIGDVIGPYRQSSAFKLAKLNDIKYLPDSVKARHILIRPGENMTADEAQNTIDSLKELVENGADFARLAAEFGSDGTAEKGGDLGWFKQGDMVQPFSDSAFFNPAGHLTTVSTQFGTHLLEVTDRSEPVKKVQVAVISRNIEPSTQTYQYVYSQASQFAGEHKNYEKFLEGIDKLKLTKRVANNLKKNDNKIAGIDNPRAIIRWAYQAEVGDISPIFELEDRFVVTALVEARDEGIASLEKVKTRVEKEVIRQKKGEKIAQQLQEELADVSSVKELGQKIVAKVETVSDLAFNAFSIPGIGIEPEVMAYAMALKEGEMSEPVKGNNGVFVIQVTSVQKAPEDADLVAEKKQLERARATRVDYYVYEALKEVADIEDKRYKFY